MDIWLSNWLQAREARKLERARRKAERKTRDRAWFGEEAWGAGAAQRGATIDAEQLRARGLPVLASEAELAEWLGIPLARLRWFTHDRPAERVWHYVRRIVPKRGVRILSASPKGAEGGGGVRVILAPKRELKALQRRVLHDLLERVAPTPHAHGFVAGRSIATNAAPHAGRALVVNLDLRDFFPGITYPRVRGLFVALGYSFAVASALALLCTEHDREAFDHQGVRYWVSVTPRALPQGAPTSPALANLAAARLDRRLAGLARRLGCAYTRYADDLTFSGDAPSITPRLLAAARRIIADEHFSVHERKTRVLRRSARQTVTGLVVNDGVGTPRALRRRLRAILHHAQHTGLEAQNRDGRPDFRAYLAGFIGHVSAANAGQGETLRRVLQKL
jgi:RNA-directed DNA polymerase